MAGAGERTFRRSSQERVSGGQIRRPHPGEKECLQCRVLGDGLTWWSTDGQSRGGG